MSILHDRHGYLRTSVVATAAFTALFAAIFGLAVLVQSIINYSERVDCRKFADSSGYQTQWSYYGFWNHECFAVIDNGTWHPVRIPIDQLRIDQGNQDGS